MVTTVTSMCDQRTQGVNKSPSHICTSLYQCTSLTYILLSR